MFSLIALALRAMTSSLEIDDTGRPII